MARRCVCKACKKQLTIDIAYCVQDRIKSYYCSKEEYEEFARQQQIKKECLDYVSEIIKIKPIPLAMAKLIHSLNEYYSYIVIKRAFKENKDKIHQALRTKSFYSSYGKYKYIMSIVLNNIELINATYQREQEEMKKLFQKENTIDIEILNYDRQNLKVKKGSDISMFLED